MNAKANATPIARREASRSSSQNRRIKIMPTERYGKHRRGRVEMKRKKWLTGVCGVKI